MAFRKCPRCELNYITDGEKLCSVCRREVKGEPDHDNMVELCSECGERPVVPGSEYCLLCLKEMSHHNSSNQVEGEENTVDASALDIGMVSSMDEIQIDDVGDDIPPREFDEMESAFGSDDEEEDVDEDEEDEDEIVVTRKRPRRSPSDISG